MSWRNDPPLWPVLVLVMALCVLFLFACRVPGTSIEAIPSVNYGQGVSGPSQGDGFVSLGFTFIGPPDARPAQEVVGSRAFLDGERLDLPEAGPELASPLAPIAGRIWRWSTGWTPEKPEDPEVAPSHDAHTEAPAIDTPWGQITMTALLAILATLGSIFGVNRYRSNAKEKDN